MKKLMKASKCMVFMKGDPAAPKCGFSRQTVELLQSLNAEFGTFDILSDEEVRQGNCFKKTLWTNYAAGTLNFYVKNFYDVFSLSTDFSLKMFWGSEMFFTYKS